MKKQSSVDWLVDQLKKQGYLYDLDIEAAKLMHKKEILDAICANQNGLLRRKNVLDALQYYKENFNLGTEASEQQ